MARRRPPASTPFGAWLGRWLDDHPDWTVEGFATEVRVSPAAVSLWLTKTKRVGVDHLREVARVTGQDFDTLWQMVYRESQAPAGAGVYITGEELEALLERAADRAVRRLLDEIGNQGGRAGRTA